MLTDNGDLVSIPVTDEWFCVGQVAGVVESSLLLATFLPYMRTGSAPRSEEIDFTSPVFMVETMNERIESGRWRIFDNRTPVNLPIPVFKVQVGMGGDYYIQNFRGEISRKASPLEVDRLRTHTSFSPSLVEDALRAQQGFGEWSDVYEKMLADPTQAVDDLL